MGGLANFILSHPVLIGRLPEVNLYTNDELGTWSVSKNINQIQA